MTSFLKKCVWGIVVVTGIGLCSLFAQESKTMQPLDLLKSRDDAARQRAYAALLGERQETIRGLLQIIDNPQSPVQQWINSGTPENLAIRALGEMRAVEAVPSLIKWADPPKGGFVIDDITAANGGFAARALVLIGKPADPALLDVLRQDTGKPIWGISLSILKEIEGVRCSEVILEDAIAKEKDPTAKAHLQAALKKVQGE